MGRSGSSYSTPRIATGGSQYSSRLTHRTDFASFGLPAWCRATEWLLLDCDDVTRRTRLRARPEWTQAMIEDAIDDAAALRLSVAASVDTGGKYPTQVANSIVSWLETHGSSPD